MENALSPFHFVNPSCIARLPIPTKQDRNDSGVLLLGQRAGLNVLSQLRRRIASEHVRAFAMDEAMHVRLRRLERRVTQVIWLTNAAHVCASQDGNTYRSAGANFRALGEELGAAQKDAGQNSAPDETAWLENQKRYLELQSQVFVVCERLSLEDAIEGQRRLEEVEQLARDFESLAKELEKSTFDPGLAVAFAMGVKRERNNLQLLAELATRLYCAHPRSSGIVSSLSKTRWNTR